MDPKLLDTLESSYKTDVENFTKFSSLGSIDYKKSMFKSNVFGDFDPDSCSNKDIESNSESKHNSKLMKKLLKIIHPDKIKIVFLNHANQSDLDKLLECSNVIMQQGYDFIDGMNLIATNTPFFDFICDKLGISKESREKINKISFDESIDRHFDSQTIEFIKRYNQLQSKTIYNFIKSKIFILISNLNSDFNQLLDLIGTRLKLKSTSAILSTSEVISMGSNDYPLETSLNEQIISIEDLATLYPKSSFSLSIINAKSLLPGINFNANIHITPYAYFTISLSQSQIEKIAKQLYTEFKYSL